MAKTVICCLKAANENVIKHRIIPLQNNSEVTIGRVPEATVSIPSPMISRKHAILKNVGAEWAIIDNKSTNGVFINGDKLKASTPYILQPDDLVELRVESKPGEPPDYVWRFLPRCRVKKLRPKESYREHRELNISQKSDITEPSCSQSRKRDGDHPHPSNQDPDPMNPAPKRQRLVSPKWSPSRDLQKKLQENEAKAQQKLAEQEQRLTELQAQLQQKEKMQEQMMEELQRKEEQMAQQLKQQQAQLESQRHKVEEEIKQNYEREIREKEKSLFNRLTQEKTRLQDEKQRVEAELQLEMARKLEEQDKNLGCRLVAEKEKLERVITQKETEQLLLQKELEASRSHHKEQEEQTVLKAKEAVLANFADLMETELQCSICNELFVQATSLNCSHSFCALCLYQWMKVKKECPVCRAKITSHLRSLVLDSYIDKMAEHLSDDMRQSRGKLVEERKAELKKLIEVDSAPRTPTRRGGRTGRGGRGRRGRGAAQQRPTTRGMTPPGAIIVESDRSSDIEEDVFGSSSSDEMSSSLHYVSSSDSDSSVEGLDDVYYGGYGSCYRCGRRGHWANGCPN